MCGYASLPIFSFVLVSSREIGNGGLLLKKLFRDLLLPNSQISVGTFGFNHHHHLELYFAISMSIFFISKDCIFKILMPVLAMMGAVLHTINVRLFEEQLAWIINHAEDKVSKPITYL